MEKKLKVGCIGLGPRGIFLFDALLSNPNVEACAVCDENEERLEAYKKVLEDDKKLRGVKYFTSYKEFLNSEVEAVIVATHIATHCDISIDCLHAGKHVLCEIPNIANFDEAKRLRKAVYDNPKQKFMVAENCCYWAFIQSWKKMYEEGLLGDVLYAESDYLHTSRLFTEKQPQTWRSNLHAVNYLTHNLGPILYILDDTCKEITGFIPDKNPLEEQRPAPPNGVAMVKTRKGTLIKIFIGFGIRHHFQHNFALYGTKGSLENQRGKGNDDNKTLAYLDCVPNTHAEIEIPITTGFPDASKVGHGGADIKMLEAFVDCILKDEKPPLDIEFGINIAIPGLLAEASYENGGKTYEMPTMSEFV